MTQQVPVRPIAEWLFRLVLLALALLWLVSPLSDPPKDAAAVVMQGSPQ